MSRGKRRLLIAALWLFFMPPWFFVLGRGLVAFEENVVVPYCESACRDAETVLVRYRHAQKRGPADACLCENGLEIEPSWFLDPFGFWMLIVMALFLAPWLALQVRLDHHDSPRVPKPSRGRGRRRRA